MSAQDSKAEIFDVFLCHNSEDKPAVREIAQKLSEEDIKPSLDEEQIRPGTSWQTALGEQIESIKSAAVFVGESGFGPWQNEEIQALLSEFVETETDRIGYETSEQLAVLPKVGLVILASRPFGLNSHWDRFPSKQSLAGVTSKNC